MARLPQPGADEGAWGDILNEYLSQSLSSDGSLKNNTVGSPQVIPLSLTTSTLAAGAVTEEKLASAVQTKLNALVSSEIANDSVSTAKLQNNSVTTAKINDNAITNAKIAAAAAIDQSKIAGLTAALAAKADTSDLSSALAAKADDSSVVHKTTDETVAGVKNFTGALQFNGISVVTATDTRLTNQRTPSDASVSADKLTDGAVVTAKVANNAITEAKLASEVQTKLNALGSSPTTTAPVYTDAIATFRAGLARRLGATPVTIVFTGSSSTAGTGASTDDRRYVNRLMDHIKREFPALNGTYTTTVQTLSQAVSATPSSPGVFGVNAGVSGTRSDTYLTATTRGQIGTLNPRVIIHMIGANDYGNGVSVAAFKANVQNQITSLDSLISVRHSHIFIHSYPRFDAAALSARVAPWSEYLAALYQLQMANPDSIAVIDTARDWTVAGVSGAASTDAMDLIGSDEIHMNDYGHEFMADLVRAKLFGAFTSTTAATAPVDTAPDITTTTLNAMTVDSVFSQTLTYTGSTATFSVISGAFPTGITLNSVGLVSGTPTTAGSYTVTVRATNSVASDDQVLTGTVTALAAGFATPYVSDSFDRADDIDITGANTDSYAGGTTTAWQSSAAAWNLSANALVSVATAGGAYLPITSADYEIAAVIKTLTSATGSLIFTIDGRRSAISSSGASQYRLRYIANGTIYLSKYVSGTETVLWTSSSAQLSVGDELALRMDGSTISVRKNGTQLQAVTDSSVTTSAFAGFSHAVNTTGSWESMKINLK